MKGCTDVVYFRNSINNLLYEFYREGQNQDIVSEKERVIKLAANLIKNDIKALDCNKNHYFSFSELNNDSMLSYIPDLLQIFQRSLVPAGNTINDIHYSGIGQSIIQMVRPRSMLCPLQVVLGAEVHPRTGSAFITRNLERSMCSHELFETSLPTTTNNTLYSADNADVQINTIDGHNTLHVMGMIRSSICNGIFSNK